METDEGSEKVTVEIDRKDAEILVAGSVTNEALSAAYGRADLRLVAAMRQALDSPPQPPEEGERVTAEGAELIAAERRRQEAWIGGEGYSEAHDDEHDEHERAPEGDDARPVYAALVRAAVCYAAPPLGWGWGEVPEAWPWEPESWKPGDPHDEVRRLVKAGALLAAEIDRLQRLNSTTHNPEEGDDAN